jgi:hypothetical protein
MKFLLYKRYQNNYFTYMISQRLYPVHCLHHNNRARKLLEFESLETLFSEVFRTSVPVPFIPIGFDPGCGMSTSVRIMSSGKMRFSSSSRYCWISFRNAISSFTLQISSFNRTNPAD